MPTNTRRLLVFACVLLVGAFSSAGEVDSVSPESLIAQARKLQELWTEGTPPVTMRAELQVFDAKNKVIPGEYIVNWFSPSRWREDLHIADYQRLRVHDAKGYWQKSGLNFQPSVIFQLDSVLDPKSVLKIAPRQSLGKIRTRNKNGLRQRCTEVKTSEPERILCFEETTSNLLSVEYPQSPTGNPPDISRIEFSAFSSVGEKRVPFKINAFSGRRIVLAVKIMAMTPSPVDDSSLFIAPLNSEFWAQCDDMREPELVGRVQPTYPASARSNFEQGRVINYAVIEADGTVSHLTLIQRATPSLESAAADAIRQWRYKPAVCGAAPVRVETSIATDFYLQR